MGNDETPSTPQRRSPAEAFDELKATVNRSASDISDLWDFTQKVKDKLLQAAELQRLEGMLPMLDSMLQIHQILFVRARATTQVAKDKSHATEQFVIALLETVEDELTRHGVQVINPDAGTTFDVQLMECTKKIKKGSRKEKPNTIAGVNRCGFLYSPPTGPKRIVSKAQVEVFEK